MLDRLRWVGVCSATALYALPAIALAVFDRGGRFSSAVVGAWSRAVLRIAGVRVEVEGLDRLPRDRPVLFLSTHRSLLDVPALYQAVPDTTRFVAKRELFRIPLFGQAIRMLGFFPIDRKDLRHAKRTLEKAAAAGADRPLLVFPEGTRNPDGGLLPFKKGAFAMAVEHRLPVVPVACIGGDERLRPKSTVMRPGLMRLRVGRTFTPEQACFESRESLAEAVRGEMERLLGGG